MEGIVGFILNGLIVLLLIAAIGYGIILNRKLVALQSAQSDLAALLGRLDSTILQASSTVHAFRANAGAPRVVSAKPAEASAGRSDAARELLSILQSARSARQ